MVDVYGYKDQPAVAFDRVFTSPFDDYRVGLKRIQGVWFVVFEGTQDAKQWMLNVEAWTTDVKGLGAVHNGFNEGLEELWGYVHKVIEDQPFVVCGHSRGAAQATIFTGYALRDGRKALRRVTVGEPRSGDAAFCKFVSTVPSASYCTEDGDTEADPVTFVPPDAPPLLPYARVAPLTYIRAVDVPGNPWRNLGPIWMHHSVVYRESLKAFYLNKKAA